MKSQHLATAVIVLAALLVVPLVFGWLDGTIGGLMLFTLVFWGFVVALVIMKLKEKKHRVEEAKVAVEALSREAEKQGWTYEPWAGFLEDPVASYPVPFTDVPKHRIKGQHRGVDFEMFQSGHGDQMSRECKIKMPLSAPAMFSISPEAWDVRVMEGTYDIDLESYRFDRRFHVACGDRRFAYDVLHAQMQEWLLEEPNREWVWHGDQMEVYEPGGVTYESMLGLLEAAVRFREMLPAHLLRGATSPQP